MEPKPSGEDGQTAMRYTWDDNGLVRHAEPLSMIEEGTEHTSTRSPGTRGKHSAKQSVTWPFHGRHSRSNSEAQSTTLSTMSISGHLRRANHQTKSFLGNAADDAMSISRSIVPDYIVHYLRGETPESLAIRREQTQASGSRRPSFGRRLSNLSSAIPIEFNQLYSSSTDLTRGVQGNSNASRTSGFRRHFSGWRGGVVLNTLVSSLILMAEIILLIIFLTRNKLSAGEGAIYNGDCGQATKINTGVHALINAFAVILLAGASYTFQVLTSPTRREVATAHEKRKWLDIGIPSMRNFAHISTFRATFAVILLVAAIAIQVTSNAIIFTTTSEDAQKCSVNLNGPLFGIVALLNLALVISMAVVLARASFDPLATVGDAIRSFLRSPDATTVASCLLTKDDVRRGRWGETEAKYFEPRTHFWLQTPSLRRWAAAFLAYAIICAPAAAALALMVQGLSPGFPLFPALGIAAPSSVFAMASPSAVKTALVASLPQLLLGVLYVTANALLTTYFLSHELSQYARGPRPLRVSSQPMGQQLTSLYLTLPRPVSWLLLTTFAGMGFALSQAVVPTITTRSATAWSAAGAGADTSATGSNPASALVGTAIAFNTTALLVLLALLFFLAAATLALGLRRAPPGCVVSWDAEGAAWRPARTGNPLALRGGACSAVLSAKCHPAGAGGWESARGHVAFGVVEGADGGAMQIGRCAFSGNGVEGVSPLDTARLYA